MVLTPAERKVKARGAHHKGKGFQRKVAKILSAWYYEGDDSKLKSTPRSGGYRNKLVGDINNLDYPDDFVLHIECKNQEGKPKWAFQDTLRENSLIEQWWEQAKDDSEISQKIPSLVFTRNYEKVYIAIFERTFNSLQLSDYGRDLLNIPRHAILIMDIHKDKRLVVFELESFLKWCDADTMRKYFKGYALKWQTKN